MAIIITYQCDKCGDKDKQKDRIRLGTIKISTVIDSNKAVLGEKEWCRKCMIAEGLIAPATPEEQEIPPTTSPVTIVSFKDAV